MKHFDVLAEFDPDFSIGWETVDFAEELEAAQE